MREEDWMPAADGKDVQLRLEGWSGQRRIVILPRRHERSVAMAQRDDVGQLWLTLPRSMMAMRSGNTPSSLLARQQEPFYRSALSRKNQCGLGGFTTRNLKRCRLTAGMVALFFSRWNLFVRLADPTIIAKRITSRALLLHVIGRQTRHAGPTDMTITSSHGEHHRTQKALTRIARFFSQLRKTAEQLTPIEPLVPNPQRDP
jgi:hypothetical protein